MDTVQHGYAGYVMAHGIDRALPTEYIVYVYAGLVFFGILPDLAGYVEKVLKNDKSKWNWYNKFHNELIFLRVIPSYGLHIYLDRLTHGAGKRWWVERKWLWIASWIMLVFLDMLIWLA